MFFKVPESLSKGLPGVLEEGGDEEAEEFERRDSGLVLRKFYTDN